MSHNKFDDAIRSKGKIKLQEAFDELKGKGHVKIKSGKVEFTPPADLDPYHTSMLTKSAQALNDLVAAGILKVDADGKVSEVTHA
jgi:hypothetical protein